MNCSICNEDLKNENAKFCDNCGSPITKINEQEKLLYEINASNQNYHLEHNIKHNTNIYGKKITLEEHNELIKEIHCPKCNSTQFHSSDKWFSAGKVNVGTVLTGGIGVLAGLHGSRKVVLTCLKCGKKWNV